MFPKTWQILRSLITLIDHFNYYTNTVVQGSSVTSAYKLDYKISDHQIEITSFTKTTSASAVGVIIPSTIKETLNKSTVEKANR